MQDLKEIKSTNDAAYLRANTGKVFEFKDGVLTLKGQPVELSITFANKAQAAAHLKQFGCKVKGCHV